MGAGKMKKAKRKGEKMEKTKKKRQKVELGSEIPGM